MKSKKTPFDTKQKQPQTFTQLVSKWDKGQKKKEKEKK